MKLTKQEAQRALKDLDTLTFLQQKVGCPVAVTFKRFADKKRVTLYRVIAKAR